MTPEMIKILVTVLGAAVGSLGFALVFGVEKRVFAHALICAVLSSLTYELLYFFFENIFISSIFAAGVTTLFAYAVAYTCKTPATIMTIMGIIPLVPGGKLYYTMLGAVSSDMTAFSDNGKQALLIASGIALGIITFTALARAITLIFKKISGKKSVIS